MHVVALQPIPILWCQASMYLQVLYKYNLNLQSSSPTHTQPMYLDECDMDRAEYHVK